MLEEIGSAELTEWVAFAALEPFGCEVEDMRAGIMPALTVNMNRDKDAAAMHPMDFFPWREKVVLPEEKPLEGSPEELAERIRKMLKAPE